ncbi:MAG: thrombospondin type 3 repeat-containing protein [Kofleriaceae bacterium]
MIDADPTADTDGDGVFDVADNCPTLANSDQRDYDTDQRGDPCDRCPHIADASDPDQDNDGVGDDCDPYPADGGEVRQRWTSFHAVTEINGWSAISAWDVNTMGVAPTSSIVTSGLQPTTPTGKLAASTMVRIDNTFGENDAAGVCMADTFTGNEYYCCALFGANGGLELRIENRWDGGSDQSTVAWPGSTTVGTRIAISGAILDEETRCVFEEVGGNAPVVRTGNRGESAPTGRPTIYTDRVIASFRYLFVVSVGPGPD